MSVQLLAKSPRAHADENRGEHKARDEVWIEHIEADTFQHHPARSHHLLIRYLGLTPQALGSHLLRRL